MNSPAIHNAGDSALGSCYEEIFQVEFLPDPLSFRLYGSAFIRDALSGAVRKLFQIRRDSISAVILFPITALRIDKNRDIVFIGFLYDFLRQYVVDHSLAVIRNDDTVQSRF